MLEAALQLNKKRYFENAQSARASHDLALRFVHDHGEMIDDFKDEATWTLTAPCRTHLPPRRTHPLPQPSRPGTAGTQRPNRSCWIPPQNSISSMPSPVYQCKKAL